MNYLAHIFLSGRNPGMQTGGFIADFVKGNKFDLYPEKIRKGILLHRQIDEYTDNHPVVREVILLLRPSFGRYSGIIADMYFDYFLAKHFDRYSRLPLGLFALRFYAATLFYYRYLPSRVKRFIFHFIGTNRLRKYRTVSGLKESLEIMAIHKIPVLKPAQIIFFLQENEEVLERKFHLFFSELITFVEGNNQR